MAVVTTLVVAESRKRSRGLLEIWTKAKTSRYVCIFNGLAEDIGPVLETGLSREGRSK